MPRGRRQPVGRTFAVRPFDQRQRQNHMAAAEFKVPATRLFVVRDDPPPERNTSNEFIPISARSGAGPIFCDASDTEAPMAAPTQYLANSRGETLS
jgi:hypothetical protein